MDDDGRVQTDDRPPTTVCSWETTSVCLYLNRVGRLTLVFQKLKTLNWSSIIWFDYIVLAWCWTSCNINLNYTHQVVSDSHSCTSLRWFYMNDPDTSMTTWLPSSQTKKRYVTQNSRQVIAVACGLGIAVAPTLRALLTLLATRPSLLLHWLLFHGSLVQLRPSNGSHLLLLYRFWMLHPALQTRRHFTACQGRPQLTHRPQTGTFACEIAYLQTHPERNASAQQTASDHISPGYRI